MSDDLFDRAETWIRHDPDEKTRAELRAVVDRARAGDAAAKKDLGERFAGPLEFGTAGLRGVMGAGETRMNRAVVRRATRGLGQYLIATDAKAAREKGVVVGFDGRHMGPEFAEDVARVLAALGIPTWMTPVKCSTPITAYAVHHLGCVAGVMVTASHNPPEYNGYKVYWSNGAQIIPPHDTGIAAKIHEAPPADETPMISIEQAKADGLARTYGEDVDETYFASLRQHRVRDDGDRAMSIVYTPMHGTGDRMTRRALAEAGFTRVTSVPEQAEPDGDFPTVAFPNPEEKGALDLAIALAKREDAPLILANDPDVDRLAVAVRDPSGKYVQLTGNQVGVLLGHYLIDEGDKKGDRLVLASCVSTPMLGVVAAAYGVHYEETLTGFKWIANRAMELEKEGLRFVFGFEEALGYTVGPLVRDKDGIGAAVLAAELAAVLRAAGKSLLDRLEELHRRYGLFISGQRSVTMKGADGPAKIKDMMRRLRAAKPQKIGALEVEAVRDFQARQRTDKAGKTTPLTLPETDMLMFDLAGGSRVIARPSGTEPKIKFYYDVREPVSEGEPLAAVETRADQTKKDLDAAFAKLAGVE
ncbi:MAG TPA: phospho-sugar mutase [Byssovorax sp.]